MFPNNKQFFVVIFCGTGAGDGCADDDGDGSMSCCGGVTSCVDDGACAAC